MPRKGMQMKRYCYAIDDPLQYSDHHVYVFGCDVPPEVMLEIVDIVNKACSYTPKHGQWEVGRIAEETCILLGSDIAFDVMAEHMARDLVTGMYDDPESPQAKGIEQIKRIASGSSFLTPFLRGVEDWS